MLADVGVHHEGEGGAVPPAEGHADALTWLRLTQRERPMVVERLPQVGIDDHADDPAAGGLGLGPGLGLDPGPGVSVGVGLGVGRRRRLLVLRVVEKLLHDRIVPSRPLRGNTAAGQLLLPLLLLLLLY